MLKKIRTKHTLNMGRGLALSSEEKAVVFALSKVNIGQSAIARRIKRSKTAVQRVLQDRFSKVKPKGVGRPSIVTPSTRRSLVRTVL